MAGLTFKVVIVGDGGVGKTTYVKRHLTGDFERKYMATMGVEVYPLRFSTNQGDVTFNIWDCAGQEKFAGLGDGYYISADAAIVMFDVTSRATAKTVSSWYHSLSRELGSVSGSAAGGSYFTLEKPWTVVGNKVDVKDRVVHPKHITGLISRWRQAPNFSYFDVSAKSNYNFEKPFLFLARQLLNSPDLLFVEAPVLRAPEVVIDFNMMKAVEQSLQEASSHQLPPLSISDDDDWNAPAVKATPSDCQKPPTSLPTLSPPQQASATWTCMACETINSSQFCDGCLLERPIHNLSKFLLGPQVPPPSHQKPLQFSSTKVSSPTKLSTPLKFVSLDQKKLNSSPQKKLSSSKKAAPSSQKKGGDARYSPDSSRREIPNDAELPPLLEQIAPMLSPHHARLLAQHHRDPQIQSLLEVAQFTQDFNDLLESVNIYLSSL